MSAAKVHKRAPLANTKDKKPPLGAKARLATIAGVAILFGSDLAAADTYSPYLSELCLNRKRHCDETCNALTRKYSWGAEQKVDCTRKCDLVQSMCLKQVYNDAHP
ncbi:hypothetical protein LMG27198_36830 [Methylocystis echinoides]|uniref:Uncharacterized protein n=1 Tax=Methylocystis echinoides TaxID=29468 RepID=A0A9W6GX19_9HYPH|nr:hypothetical protein LMG27198_36830 [Methylocystis echinoides]